MELGGLTITWLGHATFLFRTPLGHEILVDPWLGGNPWCPQAFHDLRPDATLVTHAHRDHIGDLEAVASRSAGPIVAIFELCQWLGARGLDDARLIGMNKGGTVALEALGLQVTMTDARHSSSTVDEKGRLITLGEAAGFVLRFGGEGDDGDAPAPKVYVAGDTCLFGDMALIAELWEPDVAILPIGDRFTMDPAAAARACKLLGVKAVIPCHWGTFPALTGTPDDLERALADLGLGTLLWRMEPGQTLGS